MTKFAAIIAIVASSSVAQAMPPAGQAAQPGWQSSEPVRVSSCSPQAGQAAQPGSWTPRERTVPRVYAGAGAAQGQAAQPGWSTRQ